MKIPKWFDKWYREWGVHRDYLPKEYYDRAQRIAWRAYRKGKKDQKDTYPEPFPASFIFKGEN